MTTEKPQISEPSLSTGAKLDPATWYGFVERLRRNHAAKGVSSHDAVAALLSFPAVQSAILDGTLAYRPALEVGAESDLVELKAAAERLIALQHGDCGGAQEQQALASLHRSSYYEKASPETILALINENADLNGPHCWMADDLIKELVDHARVTQANSGREDDPFAIVLLAAAARIRRQESTISQIKAQNKLVDAAINDAGEASNVATKRANHDHPSLFG